jgi:hypothetical protein
MIRLLERRLALAAADLDRGRAWTSKTTLKWRVVHMYRYVTPFRRHFHVVFDVRVVDLNLSTSRDEGSSLETSILCLYFSGSCISLDPQL